MKLVERYLRVMPYFTFFYEVKKHINKGHHSRLLKCSLLQSSLLSVTMITHTWKFSLQLKMKIVLFSHLNFQNVSQKVNKESSQLTVITAPIS